MPTNTCVLPGCKRWWPNEDSETDCIIEKLIERATEREDYDVQLRLQEIVDDNQFNAFMDVHTSCYCSYISKVHVVRVQKRKYRGLHHQNRFMKLL